MDRAIRVSWIRRRRNRWLVTFGTGAAFLLMLYIFWGADSGLRISRKAVIFGRVQKGLFHEYISLSGKVEPIQTVYLDVLDGGRIEAVVREAGSYVEKGDTIVVFTNSALLLDLTSREAQLFEQQNNLRNTRVNMDRYSLESEADILVLEHELSIARRESKQNSVLHKQKLISDDEYETSREYHDYLSKRYNLALRKRKQDSAFYRDQIEALEKSINRIKSNLALVDRSLEQLILRAPVSGFLTSQVAEIGQSIPAGTRIGQIDVLDGYKIKAYLDEYYLGQVDVGQIGEFDIGGSTYRAEVSKIYPEVSDGKFKLELSLDNDRIGDLQRGQTLRIRLELSPVSESVVLPKGAFYQSTGGGWIYVVDTLNNTAARRGIKLGRQNPQMFEVLDGLQPGEMVLISSYEAIGDADKLIIGE